MEMSIYVFLVLVLSAGFQRISGMGFSLIALPPLLWMVGPLDAVTLVVLSSALTSFIMVFSIFKEIDWSHVIYMSVPSIIIAFPTVYLLNQINESAINIAVGTLLVVCTISLIVDINMRSGRSLASEVGVGAISGFMNTAAGVAGPVVSAYAFSSGWSYRTFVATVQPYFVLADIGVLVAKYVFNNVNDARPLGAPIMVAAVAGCFVGLWLARYVSRYVSEALGRRIVILVSAGGAATILIKGISGMTV